MAEPTAYYNGGGGTRAKTANTVLSASDVARMLRRMAKTARRRTASYLQAACGLVKIN
eukprot:CAMPEP_0176285484 /NCGR_PEP_ID=MMETSP0121_2-20121125/52394_1 /TAXON_ID=160619 /ORGANISM="Kryptoperidinium foliaceum, Strain CCMP 1326" /LENGTH=57 /DNA_ID=CAMNT_0017625971 /DNA_START=106 /DNA_END=276 /DNA_ORIENTATION=-